MDDSLLPTLHQDGLVGGLVALELVGGGALVAHEALLTLQHQDWPEK